ncbi:MAG: hypothetical protein GW928_03855 [Rhodoferax sp.]|nr:hypothetical protein [Betaproteobacteria bacterium]NCN96599.1 hypothetical protein [Rhodoferax sp.]OIP14631.1 MAG: hypothetical protein AUK50_11650 [Comamonadaceae bacterium CG2_30_57_122]PJC18466.1 MAG: hypothetical protein CO065_08665 [Comamonadaceae bacterium CG_4_9_14_0_8_um_filter_57_21]NCP81532.1 hypothetical protein [Rhodoferax sp.]
MNSSKSALLLALLSAATLTSAMAQGTCNNVPERVIQVAVTNPTPGIMSHEVASIIALTHKAQAQYRRTGKPQDLARVNAMRAELASRGFGRATQNAPVAGPDAFLTAQAPHSCQLLASAGL